MSSVHQFNLKDSLWNGTFLFCRQLLTTIAGHSSKLTVAGGTNFIHTPWKQKLYTFQLLCNIECVWEVDAVYVLKIELLLPIIVSCTIIYNRAWNTGKLHCTICNFYGNKTFWNVMQINRDLDHFQQGVMALLLLLVITTCTLPPAGRL